MVDTTNPPAAATSRRHFLLLQGPPSPFWAELSDALRQRGHDTSHINCCLGDWLFWRRRGATNYFGCLAQWRAFLTNYIRHRGVTDVIYYGDRQPYHVVAQAVAGEIGIDAYVIENGYLRPDWLTLERNGMGAYSHFPDNPSVILGIAAQVPSVDETTSYATSFTKEMFFEILFHASNYLGFFYFPFYKANRYYNPIAEYFSGARRRITSLRRADEAKRIVERLLRSEVGFYVCALQLQNDAQLRHHSPFAHQGDMIAQVVASFAAHAPPSTELVFKVHPYDSGLENWSRLVRQAAERYSVVDRVSLLDGGNLNALLCSARGTIVANSTVGLHAVRNACPTITLAPALYDIAGITHQGLLRTFWTGADRVDTSLVNALVLALAGTIQVRGSFFQRDGRACAITTCVERLSRKTVNEPDAFVVPRPRMVSGTLRPAMMSRT